MNTIFGLTKDRKEHIGIELEKVAFVEGNSNSEVVVTYKDGTKEYYDQLDFTE